MKRIGIKRFGVKRSGLKDQNKKIGTKRTGLQDQTKKNRAKRTESTKIKINDRKINIQRKNGAGKTFTVKVDYYLLRFYQCIELIVNDTKLPSIIPL